MSIYLRERLSEIENQLDSLSEPPESTLRFIGQVYDGGAMPTGSERVYLVHPLLIDGSETEGAAGVTTPDPSRSIPVVVIGSPASAGDILICHALGGRWVAYSAYPLHYCQPVCQACSNARYATNGTVSDTLNGTQPMVYDFGAGAWYSPWLPFSTDHALQSGPGVDPCYFGAGKSYYFYRLSFLVVPPTPTQVRAELFLPGQTCHDVRRVSTTTYYDYSAAIYPAMLAPPVQFTGTGFTVPFLGAPSSCDPLTLAASWSAASATPAPITGATLPVTTSTFAVPKWTPPGYGFSCALPCPLPRKDLTVSWTGPIGAGSATLVWNTVTKDWTMACTGGLSIHLFTTGGGSVLGFTVTVTDNTDCTGTSHSIGYTGSGFGLGLSSYTCDPLMIVFDTHVYGFLFNFLYTKGYRTFTVTL
ncbi:MAG: hypothetical protein KGL39_27390 [Patescibacteria group bacterium]|nr:hypothetical protein [Patescibacteria group bacterium]